MVTHVEIDIEIGVFNPVGKVKPEGHCYKPPAEKRQLVEAFQNGATHGIKTRTARGSCGVVHIERADMTEHRVGLHIEETDVNSVELLHLDCFRFVPNDYQSPHTGDETPVTPTV